MEKGNIIIHPFKEEHLTTSSYDVTLGEWIYREGKVAGGTYNPYQKKHTDKLFELENCRGKEFIILKPGETILAHTNEFIGGKDHITTMMKARSSIGRNFIGICKCAGWGDVGFTNRWTMEITNFSHKHSIPLKIGSRVAQIVFLETYPIDSQEYSSSGKYQEAGTQEIMEENWKPEMMLPKLYKDAE